MVTAIVFIAGLFMGFIDIGIGLAILTIVAISSFALTIVSKKERINSLYIPTIILTSMLLVVDVVFGGIGLLRMASNQQKTETEIAMNKKAGEYATIEHVKALLPTKDLKLINYSDGDYTDDDGAIVNHFKSMNFTCSENMPNAGTYEMVRFYEHKEKETTIRVTFYKNVDALEVWAETYSSGAFSPRAHVRGSGSNYYSYNHEEGKALFEMMDAKVQAQRNQ